MSIPIDNFITTVIKATVDTTGWTFIDFGDLDNESPGRWGELNSMITGYRTFLNKEAGTQDYDWKWVSGDRYARGVLIKDAEIALLFKLKFPT